MTDTPYLGQSTDLILGQEFLTWLWFRSATGSIFNDGKGRPFNVSMEQRIVVQGGEGDHVETASVSGVDSELREARMGLTTGKKVTRAQIRLERDPEEWQVTLKAADFALGSLKTPKVENWTRTRFCWKKWPSLKAVWNFWTASTRTFWKSASPADGRTRSNN